MAVNVRAQREVLTRFECVLGGQLIRNSDRDGDCVVRKSIAAAASTP